MERDPRPHEEDVDPDKAQALSRPGGQFVGRRAVDDEDAAQELGSERRAEVEQQGN
jgi:general stress protein YciG